MDFYRDIILDHYKNPRHFGKLANPRATASVNNDFCGDQIRMDIDVRDLGKKSDENKVTDIAFSGIGCAISTASASMLTELACGKKISELKSLKVDDIVAMLGIELTPTRLKCALLPLEALHKALQGI